MKTLKDIILSADIHYLTENLTHIFNCHHSIIGMYIENLIQHINTLDLPPSDAFGLFVPTMRNGIIHYDLVYYPLYLIQNPIIIDEFEHLVPAAYPEDNVFEYNEDPEDKNVFTLSEQEIADYLNFCNLMPTKKAWRFDEDFEKMLASEILNADSFNEKLIAIQFVENLMLFHGFNIGLSSLDLLHRQLSVYHLLRSASAGFFNK